MMDNFAKEFVSILIKKNLIVTTAESCTGGLIAKMITDVGGSSAVFECGIVAYSNRIKHEVLGVKNETLNSFGAVSEETVREMVDGVMKLTGADLAVAVSGIAGPSSDDTNKPVGLIWIAAKSGNTVKVKKLENKFNENVRENNRNSAAQEALKLLCSLVED